MLFERALHSEIKLSAPSAYPATPNNASGLNSPLVQVLRCGAFSHPKYGEFEINRAVLAEMKKNFDAKVRGVDIAFDYFHKSDEEAAGWPTELFLSEDGTELWARVDWTPTAIKKLSEREIRYFSPDFAFAWTDPESGVAYKNVLFGGGLTNRPFVKEMAAIVAAEEQDQMTLQELEKKILKLAEDGEGMAAAHADLKGKYEALCAEHEELKKKLAPPAPAVVPPPAAASSEDDKKKLADSEARVGVLEKELAEMKGAKQMAEKEAAFTLMLSEGKAVAAQKDAFIKGDMTEFVKLSQPVNLVDRGHAGGAQTKAEGDEFVNKVFKLAEEKVKADSKLSMHDAISIAHTELRAAK